MILKRNLTIYEAYCRPHNHQFEAYDFSDFQYGERLVRTKDGHDFAVFTLDDNVPDELNDMLVRIYGNRFDEMERARVFDKIFGLSCDLLNEQELDASIGITCPTCNSLDVSYRDYSPPRFKSFLIPVISHEQWLSMTDQEKRTLIEEGLRKEDLL